MSTVEEIKDAISKLPEDQYHAIREWFSEEDWKGWDSQIQQDSESGALDFLIKEARAEKKKGKLEEL